MENPPSICVFFPTSQVDDSWNLVHHSDPNHFSPKKFRVFDSNQSIFSQKLRLQPLFHRLFNLQWISVFFFLVWPYTKNRFMSFFSGFFVRSTRLARLFDRSGSQAMFRFLAFALASHRPGKYLGFSLGFFWETLQLSGVVTSGRHKNYSEHHRFLAREIKHFNGRV